MSPVVTIELHFIDNWSPLTLFFWVKVAPVSHKPPHYKQLSAIPYLL